MDEQLKDTERTIKIMTKPPDNADSSHMQGRFQSVLKPSKTMDRIYTTDDGRKILLSEECAEVVEKWKLDVLRWEQDFYELSTNRNWKLANFIRVYGEHPPMPDCLRAAMKKDDGKTDTPSEFAKDATNAATIPGEDPQGPPRTNITDPPVPQDEEDIDQPRTIGDDPNLVQVPNNAVIGDGEDPEGWITPRNRIPGSTSICDDLGNFFSTPRRLINTVTGQSEPSPSGSDITVFGEPNGNYYGPIDPDDEADPSTQEDLVTVKIEENQETTLNTTPAPTPVKPAAGEKNDEDQDFHGAREE